MRVFHETGNNQVGINVIVYAEIAEKGHPYIIKHLGGILLLKNGKYRAFTYDENIDKRENRRWIVNSIEQGKNKILSMDSGKQLVLQFS